MKQPSLEQKVQRALDIAEVQNVMSKHAYYHGWKLWHLHMYTDLAVPPGKSWLDPTTRSAFSAGDTVERPPEMKPDIEKVTYREWSPTTVPQLTPMPEPYFTFSETFSYGP